MSYKELKEKYQSESREYMTEERENEFVNDCFGAYEGEGFSNVFWTPYDSMREKIGLKFRVISRVNKEQEVLEALPMWNIEFEDGFKTCAYPEEVIKSEMLANGYIE